MVLRSQPLLRPISKTKLVSTCSIRREEKKLKPAVLVTGVSPESIGSSTAFNIASQGPSLLILASRTQSKLDAVKDSILDAFPSVDVRTVALDLMSQKSVRKGAAEINALTPHINVTINNAGIMTLKRHLTEEGIEAQFGANHIGHFLLTKLLMPQLIAAAKSDNAVASRVINLTSLGHRLSPIRFHDYNFEGKEIPPEEQHPPLPPMFSSNQHGAYNGYVSYGQAKTANILFSVELNERFREKGVISYAVHPGCECAAVLARRSPILIVHSYMDRLE